MVNIDAEGELTAISDGDLVFHSRRRRQGPMSRTPITCYYGFWVKKTTEKDGATTYNAVQTFVGATGIEPYRRERYAACRGHRELTKAAPRVCMRGRNSMSRAWSIR